jgi:hypothetical protein
MKQTLKVMRRLEPEDLRDIERHEAEQDEGKGGEQPRLHAGEIRLVPIRGIELPEISHEGERHGFVGD